MSCDPQAIGIRIRGTVIDAEGHRRARPARGLTTRFLRILPVAGLLAVAAPTALATTAGATAPLADAQSHAAALESQIQQTGRLIDALDQRYQAALAAKAQVDQQVSLTNSQITKTTANIGADRSTLHVAAIEAYVTGGPSSGASTIFSGSQSSVMDSSVYNQVVTGDLGTAVAQMNTAVGQLHSEQAALSQEDAQAARAVATANAAYQHGQALLVQQDAALAQVNGRVAAIIEHQRAIEAAQQRAAALAAMKTAQQAQAAAAATAAAAPASPAVTPASTPASTATAASGAGFTVAVRAAETQVGTPYVWGAEDPGVGFDCSGLVAWAWSQAGVDLPHYSGAQMADSTPVSISDLQPGDLLFYGPGGDAHVAMYVGGGEMIEATFPGTAVRVDPVRFGTTFAGAGRP